MLCAVWCKLVKLPGRSSSRFATFPEFVQKMVRKWPWPISRDSAQFSKRVDIRFLNVL